ncbi:MAG: hypothetical protein OEX16_02500 [Hadesarchaea archaeon]|nr:hypothetical protein [Hadesarchaea archaeon]MDH5596425.1 hypothetical protein [Candidatus Bathyarchaeota archaeon]
MIHNSGEAANERSNIIVLLKQVHDIEEVKNFDMFKSMALGLKLDNPSEKGVITRVVKRVKIYSQ